MCHYPKKYAILYYGSVLVDDKSAIEKEIFEEIKDGKFTENHRARASASKRNSC